MELTVNPFLDDFHSLKIRFFEIFPVSFFPDKTNDLLQLVSLNFRQMAATDDQPDLNQLTRLHLYKKDPT